MGDKNPLFDKITEEIKVVEIHRKTWQRLLTEFAIWIGTLFTTLGSAIMHLLELIAPFLKEFVGIFKGNGTVITWLALFAVIFILLYIFLPKKNKARGQVNSTANIFTKFINSKSKNNSRSNFSIFVKNIRKSILPSYNTKVMFKSLTRFGRQFGVDTSTEEEEESVMKDINGLGETKREIFTIGRCDNLTMKEKGPFCVSTSVPKPIEWIIDSDNMTDYNNISEETKRKLINNGDKYKITIPWDINTTDGTHYYPNCSKATFTNGDSAAYLFTDEKITECSKRKVQRDTYSEKKRPTLTSWKGLTNYLN